MAFLPAGQFMKRASAAGVTPVITEDATTGRITVGNDVIKGVWHYKTLPNESYNQGGGNLYELYDKTSDPGMTKNIASFTQAAGWGNGKSTPIWIGIGGSGSTSIYAAGAPPAPNANYSFTDFISDNNLDAQLESHSTSVDAQGDAILNFTYSVHNQTTGKVWYRVVKQWTITPAGSINLRVNWTLLQNGWYSEPGIHFKWDRTMQWDRWEKYGSDFWGTGDKYTLGSSNLAKYLPADLPYNGDVVWAAFDELNRFKPDWVAFTGSASAPTVTMTGNLGFTGGSFSERDLEQNVGETKFNGRIIGEYGMHWLVWWGGNPPTGSSRYQELPANTGWTDNFTIRVSNSVSVPGPEIYQVGANFTADGALVSWVTDSDSNSSVEIKRPDGSWYTAAQDTTLERSHQLRISGLDPAGVYSYRVKSTNAQGNLAVSSGYTLESSNLPSFNLTLSEQNAYWQSYTDYLNGRLTVDFAINNKGSSMVRSVNILSVRASSGVTLGNNFPISLGDIPVGSSSNFSVTFMVPSSVVQYVCRFTGSALGPNGEVINLP